MTIESKTLGAGGLEIGDYVATERTALLDGKVLLPLGSKGRVLTAPELATYPLLAAALSDGMSMRQSPTQGNIDDPSITLPLEARGFGVTADGSVVLAPDGSTLIEFNYSTLTQSTEISGAAGDKWLGIGISADGVIRAAMQWDASITSYVLRVSNNSGGSYTSVFTGTGSATNLDRGAVYVSPDGSVVVALVPLTNGMRYVRIDNPAGSLVLDVSTDVTGNLINAGAGVVGGFSAGFSDDGTALVVSYVTTTGTKRTNLEISEDSGATFSALSPYFMPPGSEVATETLFITTVDPLDINKIFVSHNRLTYENVFYSVDKGVTWAEMPLIGNNRDDSNSPPEPFPWSQMTPRIRGGFMLQRMDSGATFGIRINDGGTVDEYGVLSKTLGGVTGYLDVGWAVDGLSAGAGGVVSGTEAGMGLGLIEIGKFLPPRDTVAKLKIVADAP